MKIELSSGSEREIKTREQLLALLKRYDLRRWLFTKAELRVLYPKVPIRRPEGARDEYSIYLHLIICYLEYRALLELLGPAEAERVLDFWAQDHYTWIYKTVRAEADRIGAVVNRHALVP